MKKYDKTLIILIILLIIISLISIYSAEVILNSNDFFVKQIVWYILGIILMFSITKVNNKYLFKYSIYLYILGNIMLFLLLIFGSEINNAKCWFTIPYIGSFQPSEFMKIILILFISTEINKYKEKYKNPSIKEEFAFLIKIFIITFIPSILTFLEPDTGVVIIYLIIVITMLFISGIRIRWFIILFGLIFILLGSILLIYFTNKELFIKILGSDFFLRIDRLLDWSKKLGFQLENGLTAIGSAGIFGHGINNTPLYFPEAQTDFIFAVFASNYGFIGGLFLISTILLFDLKILNIGINSKKNINKYLIAGTLGMLIYQQFQNIGMTLGILPITGITLPFISYGGSSLLSYMIIMGIILNMDRKKHSNYEVNPK